MVRYALWLGFSLRFAVAVWNGFFGPSYGADRDALLIFHQEALDFAQNHEIHDFSIGHVYSDVLGAVYLLTYPSVFIGSLFSVATWVFSALVLIRVMGLLALATRDRFIIMLIYAVLPSSFIYTSVTLREVFELLFVNLALYSALKIYLRRCARYWLLLVAAVIGMGLLHGGLFAFGIYFILGTLVILAFRKGKRLSLATKFLILAPFGVVFVVLGFSLFTGLAYRLENGIADSIQMYRLGNLLGETRAQYATDVNIDGITGLATFLPYALFQYLFEPVPWHMSAIQDFELVVENLLRAWLMWNALRRAWRIRDQRKRLLRFLIASYFVQELLWAIGTVNWGQAARHHIPGMAVLLVCAFPWGPKERVSRRSFAHARPRPVSSTLNALPTASS